MVLTDDTRQELLELKADMVRQSKERVLKPTEQRALVLIIKVLGEDLE